MRLAASLMLALCVTLPAPIAANASDGNRSHPPSLATFEARDYSGGGDGGDRWRG